MAMRRALVVVMVATLFAAAGCGDEGHTAKKPDRVTQLLSRMTPEQKVGQLFVAQVSGDGPDASSAINMASFGDGVDTAAKAIARYNPGGIIYFRANGNLVSPQQTAEFSNGLQQAANRSGGKVPLLISTDQENGTIDRVRAPATVLPGGMALGSSYLGAKAAGKNSADAAADARLAAEITGQELRAMGINADHAPIADVNTNPANPVIGVRSVSSDPGIASELVSAQVKGLQSAGKPGQGVSASAKHFPGHGDTSVDSHTGIPVVNISHDEWSRVAAPPFRAAIKAGVDSIMTAHIVMPQLDPSGNPATLSRPILTGLLRKELGFKGVVFTDSLVMQGVRNKYGDDRVPVLAIKAGADMLLTPPKFQVAYNGVLAAVKSGEISRRRLDESVTRILRMKSHRGVLATPMVDISKLGGIVGTKNHLETAQRIADDSITKLRDDGHVLPAAAGSKILVTGWSSFNYTGNHSSAGLLADRLAAHGAKSSALVTGAEPSAAEISSALKAAKGVDTVVVLTNRTASDDAGKTQASLIKQLVSSGARVITIAVREPYDAGQFTEATTWLASYGYGEPTLESLAKVITGELSPAGRLPVSILRPDGGVAYALGAGG
ncbi:MAG TPA: glycoside hydrolase family 3 N-terminal domain-containing protein [Mycobacteriales bacterium]|jgi:beta-N-acetylhexosaminidase|nr:glycoside hydrolase family 3 N-terminal domain-containing protein [Mycobacteriales bacterium]